MVVPGFLLTALDIFVYVYDLCMFVRVCFSQAIIEFPTLDITGSFLKCVLLKSIEGCVSAAEFVLVSKVKH